MVYSYRSLQEVIEAAKEGKTENCRIVAKVTKYVDWGVIVTDGPYYLTVKTELISCPLVLNSWYLFLGEILFDSPELHFMAKIGKNVDGIDLQLLQLAQKQLREETERRKLISSCT